MIDELFAVLHGRYEEQLAGSVARGIIAENGYWHQMLREGPIRRGGDLVTIWTGLFLKPPKGVWLLTTCSFNRRAKAGVTETVIASGEGYPPCCRSSA